MGQTAAPMLSGPSNNAVNGTTASSVSPPSSIDLVAVTLTSPADVTTRRAALINETWGTSTLPSTLPTVTTTSDPFAGSLPDVGAVYDYHAAMSNGQVNDSDLYMNSQPNGRVVIMNMGHQGTTSWPSFDAGYNTVPMMTALLDAGYSIFAMNMPGGGSTAEHNALFNSYGSTAMEYFLEPAVQAMNYWDARSSFSQYDFVGLSGGAWTGTVLQALDTRVKTSIVVAGSLPGIVGLGQGDAEQNWAPFYSTAGWVDLYLMGASGPGRSQLQILNINDNCCFGPLEWSDTFAAANQGRTWYQQVSYYSGELAAAAATVPSDFSVVEDSTATQHQISNPFAVDLALSTLSASAVCFAAGTRIAAEHGDVAVEDLRAGDRVVTLEAGSRVLQTVRWIGRRRLDLRSHPNSALVAPVRIRGGAFTDGVPNRDLVVSPDHAILTEGGLMMARQLINHGTICQETDTPSVEYFHVLLDRHAILLAEGLPAESYLDTGNRGFFDNGGEPLVLHPDLTDEANYPTREASSCAPFVWDEARVRPVWQRLAERAAAMGQPVPQRTTTTDAGLRLLFKGRSVKPIYGDDRRMIFTVPRGAREVRLVSRAQSPTAARPWLEDRRRLGIRVKRMVLRGTNELREIPMDHPDLTEGWWDVERDGQVMSRWTNGEVTVLLPEMNGDVMLEVHLAGEMIYAVEAELQSQVERRAA
jgi:hypothetical protein